MSDNFYKGKARSEPNFDVDHLDAEDDESTRDLDVGWFAEHAVFSGLPRPSRLRVLTDAEEKRREEAFQRMSTIASESSIASDSSMETPPTLPRSTSMPNINLHTPSRKPPQLCPCSCMRPHMMLLQIFNALRSRSSGISPEASMDSSNKAVLIFDWDDTLLPTTFILKEVHPRLPRHLRDSREPWTLPASSPFYEELAAHARLVAFVLRAASEFAQVAIVTLSMAPWIPYSSEKYLPGLDMEALLKKLQIPVYYSREHYDSIQSQVSFETQQWETEVCCDDIGMKISRMSDGGYRVLSVAETGQVAAWNAEHPDASAIRVGDRILQVNDQSENLVLEMKRSKETPGRLKMVMARDVPDRDAASEAKRIDMAKCLRKFYGDADASQWNVISVGDSVAEERALKAFFGDLAGGTGEHLRCKTVKLLDQPTIEQLSNELRVLLVWLPRMVGYGQAFDLAMDKLDDLEKEFLKS